MPGAGLEPALSPLLKMSLKTILRSYYPQRSLWRVGTLVESAQPSKCPVTHTHLPTQVPDSSVGLRAEDVVEDLCSDLDLLDLDGVGLLARCLDSVLDLLHSGQQLTNTVRREGSA